MIFTQQDATNGNLSLFMKLKCQENKIKSGSECLFIPINSRRALKAFPTEEYCQIALENQLIAAKHEIGPPVLDDNIQQILVSANQIKSSIGYKSYTWNMKKMQDDGFVLLWSYVTFIVKTIEPNDEREYDYDLSERMKEHGFSARDLHADNIGIYKGKLVCIDFGVLSS